MNRRRFCFGTLPLAVAGRAQGAELPRPSPDLNITFPGKPASPLSRHKGKVIAVEFLLTTCPHCQKASQAIERVYRELGPKGFQPIGLAINPEADVAAFARQFNLSFPVGLIAHDVCTEYMQHPPYLRLLMPQLAFIDRKFMVRKQFAGDSPLFSEGAEEKNIRAEVVSLL